MRKGYTLQEVLIAAAIIGLFLAILIASFYPASIKKVCLDGHEYFRATDTGYLTPNLNDDGKPKKCRAEAE